MKKTLLIFGLFFLLVSLGLGVVGIFDSALRMGVWSMAIVVFFGGYWILYAGIEAEKSSDAIERVGVVTRGNRLTWYAVLKQRYSVPVMVVMFGNIPLAILVAFQESYGRHVWALVLLIISIVYSVFITVYFTLRLQKDPSEKSVDDIAVMVAYFCASLATFGLLPIIVLMVKNRNKNKLVKK